MNDEVKKAATPIPTLLAVDFTRAWLFMLGMGALHGEITDVPHPGYWASVLIICGISAVGGAFRKGNA